MGRLAFLSSGQFQAGSQQLAMTVVPELRGSRHQGIGAIQASGYNLGLVIMSEMDVAGSENAIRRRPLRELLNNHSKPWDCLVEAPIEEIGNGDAGNAAAVDPIAWIQFRRRLEAGDGLVEVAGVQPDHAMGEPSSCKIGILLDGLVGQPHRCNEILTEIRENMS